MRKRLISMMLVLCIILTIIPIQVFALDNNNKEDATLFTDVPKDSWYYDSVMSAVESGLFLGTSETTFSPSSAMTRAMYITVLGRMMGVDLTLYADPPAFSDVVADSYYAPYVQWAVEKGITEGVGENLFDPNGFVTRQQMATLIVRLFESYNITFPAAVNTSQPKDIDLVDDWAKDAVLKLWSCGLFVGDEKGNFDPHKSASRAEGTTLLYRVDNHLIDNRVKDQPSYKPDSGSSSNPKYTVNADLKLQIFAD